MSSVSKTIKGSGKQNPGAKSSTSPRVDIQADSATGNNLLWVGDGSANSLEVRKDAIIINRPVNSNVDINGSLESNTLNTGSISCGNVSSLSLNTNRNAVTCGSINSYGINTNGNSINAGNGYVYAKRFTFPNDGAQDTYMDWRGDGIIDFYTNGAQTLILQNGFMSVVGDTTFPSNKNVDFFGECWFKKNKIVTNGGQCNVLMKQNSDGQLLNVPSAFVSVINSNITSGSSSRQLKENIESTEFGIDDLNALNVVDFDWKDSHLEDKSFLPKRDTGLIAEEVAETMPHLALKDEDGEAIGVRYRMLAPLLVKVCQDQQKAIERLEERIKALEEKVTP